MAKSWTLIDDVRDVNTESLSLEGDDLGGASGSAVRLRTLRGGLREGVRVLTIDNGTFRFDLLPQRGMGVWKAYWGDAEIGWKSPVRGPVHPQWVPVSEPSGLGWLDGFDELVVRCGLHSNGAPEFDEQGQLIYPLHGRIANLPAHHLTVEVDEETGEIAVTGTVDEMRFHFQKLRLTSTIRTRPGEHGFRIQDRVQNLSGTDGETQMLYHINLGEPLHAPGAELIAPVKQVAPREAGAARDIDSWSSYGAHQPGAAEQVYFFELYAGDDGRSQVLLKGVGGQHGVGVAFDTRQLPCFIQWKNTAAAEDGYVTGLEPATNFPNPRSFEGTHGRVVSLPPGGTVTYDLQLQFHPDAASVAAAERQIAALQSLGAPAVHPEALDNWSC